MTNVKTSNVDFIRRLLPYALSLNKRFLKSCMAQEKYFILPGLGTINLNINKHVKICDIRSFESFLDRVVDDTPISDKA